MILTKKEIEYSYEMKINDFITMEWKNQFHSKREDRSILLPCIMYNYTVLYIYTQDQYIFKYQTKFS